jgi:HK97 family phage major capsid protein
MTTERTATQTRILIFDVDAVREADDGIPVVISTDSVVAVADGPEILVHTPEAVDLRRAPLPIITGHGRGQVNVGIVDNIVVRNGQLRGIARFGSRPEAAGYRMDVMNRIIRSVSVGYARLHGKIDKQGVLFVDRWMPTHAAMVSEPADINTGFFRANEISPAFEIEPADEIISGRDLVAGQPAVPATTTGAIMADVQTTAPAGASAESQVQDNRTTVQLEEDRIAAIRNLSRAFDIPAAIERNWIVSGTDWNKIGTEALAYRETQKNAVQQSQAYIDMPTKDVKRYSMWRALDAVVSGDWSKAGLELEASRAVSSRTGRANNRNGFFIPVDVQQRDLTVGTNSAGGYLRATDNISFIELLRNRMVAFQMGATRLSGLVGNVTIPKQTAGATAYWLSTEATAITEGNQTFGQLALTPRTVGAYTEISRLLQLQSSPDAEQIIMTDLAKQVAIAADLAVLAGTGTEQPTGIVGTGSIGGVTGTSIALAGILEFQSDVASANALSPSCGYVTTPLIASLLMARQRFTSTNTPLWEGNMLDGQMLGFKAMTSMQCPTGDIIFGDFSQVVVGEWGVLELAVNTAANFPAGITGIRAMYTMDVGVRYAGAFSLATSVT